MLSKEEIQEWIDGEEKGRRTKPNVYCGNYLTYSYAWSKGLEYCKEHNEDEVREEFKRASQRDLDNNFSAAGYYKAIRLCLDEK